MKDYHPTKYKRRRLSSLDTETKIKIINSIVIDKQTHVDAARIHKVAHNAVKVLVKKVKKNKDYTKELLFIDS